MGLIMDIQSIYYWNKNVNNLVMCYVVGILTTSVRPSCSIVQLNAFKIISLNYIRYFTMIFE